METIKNQKFGGERPLFGVHDVRLEDIEIVDGESGIKCCKQVECHNSKFYGKYPWWHVDGSLITNCYFAPGSRSAIWYSDDMVMRDCVIDGPKFFREMKNVTLENVKITDADETFWRIDGLKIKNVELHQGTYPFMFSKNIYVDGLVSDAKICVPILSERGDSPCEDYYQGQFLGVRQRRHLRLRAPWRVSRLAQQEHPTRALPYQRRATSVL